MSGVKLGGRESNLTIPECGLAIMRSSLESAYFVFVFRCLYCMR